MSKSNWSVQFQENLLGIEDLMNIEVIPREKLRNS